MDNRSNIVYYDPHVYSVDMLYVYPMLRGLGQPSIPQHRIYIEHIHRVDMWIIINNI
jgi:hypothetical protein